MNTKKQAVNKSLLLKKGRRTLGSLIRLLILLAISYIVLYPFFSMLSFSFRNISDLTDPSVVWLPKTLDFVNYEVAARVMNYGSSFLRTVLIMMVSAGIEVLTCALPAYGFARFKFPAHKLLFGIVLIMAVVPPQSIMLPLFLNYKNLNLIDSPLVFYLPSLLGVGVRSGLFIFIYRQFFAGLPKELEEAAWIDGAGPLKTFFRIIVPSSGVAFVTVGIFSMIWHWNEYYQSIVLFRDPNKLTLSVALGNLFERLRGERIPEPYTISYIMAGCVLFVLPMMLVYLVLQKQFVRSIDRVGIVG